MRTGELIAAAFWLAFALAVTIAGANLGLGSLRDPGSGFMIFWVGAAMVAFSLGALVAAARQPACQRLVTLWRDTRWYLIPYVTVLLGLYAWALPLLGFLTVTVLLLLVLFRTIEPQGWGASILGAVVSTGAADLVFHRWLGTQLPRGLLIDRFAPWIF